MHLKELFDGNLSICAFNMRDQSVYGFLDSWYIDLYLNFLQVTICLSIVYNAFVDLKLNFNMLFS